MIMCLICVIIIIVLLRVIRKILIDICISIDIFIVIIRGSLLLFIPRRTCSKSERANPPRACICAGQPRNRPPRTPACGQYRADPRATPHTGDALAISQRRHGRRPERRPEPDRRREAAIWLQGASSSRLRAKENVALAPLVAFLGDLLEGRPFLHEALDVHSRRRHP